MELLYRYSNLEDLADHLHDLANRPPPRTRRDEATTPRPAPRRQRRLNEAQTAELVASYQAGATLRQLAAQFGIHRDTVSLILERADVTKRRKGLTARQLQQATELYAQGWSTARLGQLLHVSPTTIRTDLHQAGVELRRPWERAGT